MERLFYKKKFAVMTVALAIVLVFLLCVLLGFLVQYTNLIAVDGQLRELIKAAEADEQKMQELLEYRKTNEYVIEWAEKMGYLKKDVTVWLENNK
ncbi:MAG: hypothetical protein NC132_04335 [Corallococcus sp.]|nr:hypothetical protein [Corallococcus sp.]MCM1359888.1 hypothetical protein [Corallococcus sp.]MCM1395322.1 hypothetical protein [Corallococcus sp.]